jgi:putative transposase
VTKTATVSLHNNVYQVDPILCGRKVELVFDPFDMTDVEVRHHARSYGLAVAFRIGRHSHPKARPDHVAIDQPPTGIDYLHLIGAVHAEVLGERVNYAALTGADPRLDQTGEPA